ncbi:NAD(P)-dependent glycerol-3-phosphate dehydrogenase [Holosporaceae bacterium 'Namur']|nr:NAD(P)-dependent glycerol-3-phosphate dehydrogenase [Holosporaceae bacterium 'Namur']
MNKGFKNILIIGDGAWGTALAVTAANNIENVIIYSRDLNVVDSINKNNINPKSFPSIKLPANIAATDEPASFKNAELILIAIPAQVLRKFLSDFKEYISNNIPIVICAKGIENDTLNLMSEVCRQIIPQNIIAILSGPNFASEIAVKKLSASLIACEHEEIGISIVRALSNPTFRCYYSNDIIGVQIAGAAKNVIAIAAGILEGLNLGENAKAALVTRGLNEITRLSTALNGNLETSFGLAGIGDLILTCGSRTSRNMSLGFMLASGKPIGEILNENGTYEGYPTSLSINALCEKLNLDLPIFKAVYRVLYQGSNIEKEIDLLVNRPLKAEKF